MVESDKSLPSRTECEQGKALSRVLSIQSHVVRGYVGNKAAVFPLQLLGHHVDFINSVQFTSMYVHEGQKLEGAFLKRLLNTLPLAQQEPGPNDHPGPLQNEGMVDKTLLVDHRYLLTGYVGTSSALEEIVDFVKNQKKNRSHSNVDLSNQPFSWLCDPVMGDNGKPYVSPDLIELYRTAVVPVADILTPNQYELEWLCDRKIRTLEDAVLCCHDLHMRGPKIVIVTSIALPPNQNVDLSASLINGNEAPASRATDPNTDLILLASERRLSEKEHQFIIRFPRLNVYLGGTGDLMAAMLLYGLDQFSGRLDLACERALAVLQVRRYGHVV